MRRGKTNSNNQKRILKVQRINYLNLKHKENLQVKQNLKVKKNLRLLYKEALAVNNKMFNNCKSKYLN